MKSSYPDHSLEAFTLKLVTDESLYVLYPSLATLAEIVSVYPASTSEVERGFSYQNAIKTKFRNKLGSDHLDQLLRLHLNSPDAHSFPFRKAYKQWMESKRRRYVVRKPEIDSDSDSDDNN